LLKAADRDKCVKFHIPGGADEAAQQEPGRHDEAERDRVAGEDETAAKLKASRTPVVTLVSDKRGVNSGGVKCNCFGRPMVCRFCLARFVVVLCLFKLNLLF